MTHPLAMTETRLERRRDLRACMGACEAAKRWLDGAAPGWRRQAGWRGPDLIVAAARLMAEAEAADARRRLADRCSVWALERLAAGIAPPACPAKAAADLWVGLDPDGPAWTIPVLEDPEAEGLDRIAIDVVLVPLAEPAAWRRITGAATMLGERWLAPLALVEGRRMRPLAVHRSPAGWLAGGGAGWCPLVVLDELDPWLLDGVAELVAEDREHAAELDRWQRRRKVRRPRLRYRRAAA